MRFTLLASALLAITSGTALAQAKPDGQWHGSMAAGLSFATGNTKSTSISANGDGSVETAADKISAYGMLLNASSDNAAGASTKTADLFRVGGRYDYNLSPVLYAFGGLEFEKDGVQGLDLRSSINAGIGYKVIRDTDTTFDVFAGVGYTANNYKVGNDVNGSTALLGEESTHKLSATSTFKQRLVLYPAVSSDLGNRATWDATLSTALAGNLTLNVTYGLRYASKVPAGVNSSDSLLLVGVGYKF